MFDCVADNLIENASNKLLREHGIRITVYLSADPLVLSVTDSGSSIPHGLAQRLLRTVLPSEDGLGVGLYQAARWARQKGYRLTLGENHAGKVRFELTKE
jgi:sensor histidine kinase regulating citrate/malate metabolism